MLARRRRLELKLWFEALRVGPLASSFALDVLRRLGRVFPLDDPRDARAGGNWTLDRVALQAGDRKPLISGDNVESPLFLLEDVGKIGVEADMDLLSFFHCFWSGLPDVRILPTAHLSRFLFSWGRQRGFLLHAAMNRPKHTVIIMPGMMR
jgi:hypothetical protein